MSAKVVRKRTVRDRTVYDVEADGHRYQVWVVPCKGMNYEIVGYRTWIGPALPIVGDPERATSAALRAIERMRQFYVPEQVPSGL